MALRCAPDRVAPRRPRRTRAFPLALVAALVAAGWAAPAWSADVVAVRIGQHPEFTRVVFELDAPTGYRVTRTPSSDGSEAIVVTLDASSRSQTIRSGSSLLRSVGVEPAAGKTTARVALRKSGLPLKEMILSNPPRIVLDVLGTDTALVKRAPAPVAKRTKPAPTAPVEVARKAPEPKPAPKAEPAPTPPVEKPVEPKVQAKAQATPPPPKPPAPQVAKPAPPPAPTAKAPTPPTPPSTAEGEAGSTAAERDTAAEKAARDAMEARLAAVREAADARREEAEAARAAREAREIEQAKQRERAETADRAAEADSSEGTSIDPTLIGGIAVGLALLVALIVMMRRRRSLPKDLDVTMLADDEGGAPGARGAATGMDFAIGGDQGAGRSADADLPARSTSEGPGSGSALGETDRTKAPLSAPGLFDELDKHDEPDKGASTMDHEMHDSGADTVQSAPLHSAGASGGSDVVSMMREMERRMAGLESRLEEEMAARERLERQVAAQSEELRVQRAAIARTQRALRGLSRSDEEQATEPALRDPS